MKFLRVFPRLSLVCLTAAYAGTTTAADDSTKAIVGTWQIQSWVATDTESGAVVNVFGEKPSGHIIYTTGGNMAVMLTADGRKNLSGDRYNTPAEERAQAFSTHAAYSGTYEVTGEGIMHHVKASSFQNWVGTDQLRYVDIKGDTLTMKTPPLKGPPDGKTKVMTLVFKRME
jgi:hypothetical protein